MTRVASILLVAAAVALSVDPGMAKSRRHHHADAPAQPAPARHEFYPEHVEGGVTGNLTFNNQIRKHTDPLNANGAQ